MAPVTTSGRSPLRRSATLSKGFEQPPGQIVRIRDLRRDDAVTVRVHIRHVTLHAEIRNLLPRAFARSERFYFVGYFVLVLP